jgi:transposase InsO family protein
VDLIVVKQRSGVVRNKEFLGGCRGGNWQEAHGPPHRSWGEFTSLEFRRYYAERGVERQRTTPYSPQQNGVVEWHNQSVVTMAWYMLKAKALPGYFWGEAASTVIYILNRSPTRALDWKTAYEAWHGELPTVHYFHTFGRVAYIKNM